MIQNSQIQMVWLINLKQMQQNKRELKFQISNFLYLQSKRLQKKINSKMQKQLKQTFIELPLNTFKKKSYPIPHFLFQTKLQRNPKNLYQIKKLIEAQDYQYIGQISQERNIYCCKEKTNDRLIVIQIKEVCSKNHKSIYLSVNLTPALKKDIRKYFMLKNWKIIDKIYLQDEKGQSGLVILEYNFVENDLRNFMKKQFELDQKISTAQVSKICKDIIESLSYYHLESTVIHDIRPETIMYEDGKWFILNGDNAFTNKSTEFGSSITKSVGFRPISCLYLSPIMFESFIKNNINIPHNPYKSDIYSLGLIIWELLTIGTIQPSQVRKRLENRKEAHVSGIKEDKYFNFRQKIFIQNNKGYIIPNILRMMLEENEQQRSYIIEICLAINLTSNLFSKIIVPFENFFKKQVIDNFSSSRKKIQYPHASMEYDGDTLNLYDNVLRHGRGTMMHNNVKVFDGEWQNNLPDGKCSAIFSSMWSYEGMMNKGNLHGQGVLTFNGIRIGGTNWIRNLEEDIITNTMNPLEAGYYLICPDAQSDPVVRGQKRHGSQLSNMTTTHFSTHNFSQSTNKMNQTMNESMMMGLTKSLNKPSSNVNHQNYKIYFEELHNHKSKYVLNFTQVPLNEITKVIEILITRKFFLRDVPTEVEIYENVKYQRYFEGNTFDLIRIGFKQSGNTKKDKRNSFMFSQTESQQLIEFKEAQSMKRQCKMGAKQTNKPFPHSQIGIDDNEGEVKFIDIILPVGKSPQILTRLLHHLNSTLSNRFNLNASQSEFVLPLLNLSNCTMSDDEFREVIECGIKVQSINISKCPNLSDLAVKYLAHSPFVQAFITQLHLEGLKISNQGLQELRYFEALKKLRVLNFSHCPKLTNDKIAQFLCDQRLSGLGILQIAGLLLNHRGLEKIALHGNLKSLQKLNIGSCHQLTESALFELIKSPQMRNLKSFECYSTTIKDIFLEALSNDDEVLSLPELSNINLSGSINFTSYGISKFLLSKSSKSLMSINLSNLDISDDFVELLGKRNLLNPQLAQLNLSACFKVSDKGIKELLRTDRLLSLKKLDLSKTNVSNDTLFLLAQSSQRKLQQVRVYKCSKMNDLGFEKLLLSVAISKVRKLQIGGTSVKQVFFTTMVSEKTQISLEQLYLNECQEISQKALCQLMGSKRMAQLRLLDISSTRLSNKVIQAMNRNPYLKSHMLHLITTNCFNPKGEQLQPFSIPSGMQYMIKEPKSIIKTHPQKLARNPILLKMTELELSNQSPEIQKLFASNYIINLTKLQLKWQECTLALRGLATNLRLNNFKQLSLLGSKFDELSLVQMIKSSTVKNLEVLNLSWTDITNQALYALSTSPFITSLRSLNLSKCSAFNDKGFVRLIQSSKVSLLVSLDIRSTLITNSSLQALGKSKTIKSLSKLVCRSCPNISDIGFKDYFISGNCSSLKQLDVGWTRVEGNLFSHISKSKILQLTSLKIGGLRKIEFELAKLLQSIAVSNLQELELNFAQISSATIEALTNSKYLQGLQRLEILGQDFMTGDGKDSSMIKLLESTNTSKLTMLKISFNNCPQKISQKIFAAIQKNLNLLQKLCLLQAIPKVIEKAKKIFKKKCQVVSQE